MMVKPKKLLLLPIELYQREFDVKLYIALKAVDLGYEVIICDLFNPELLCYENASILYKDHAKWSLKYLKDFMDLKSNIYLFDEEGLIIGNPDLYAESRVSSELAEKVDAIFSWGTSTKKIIQGSIATKDIVVTTGCPKFDLTEVFRRGYKRKDISSNIKVLLNTRFSFNNGLLGEKEIENLQGLGVIRDEEDIVRFKKFLLSEEAIFNEFIRLLYLIKDCEGISATIRPHPSELTQVYEDIAGGNISVDRHADLREQILEHDVVIHDGCTTAIEAQALGVKVVGLRPAGLKEAYDEFANQFSYNFEIADDVVEFIKRGCEPYPQLETLNSLSSNYIDNWKWENGNATERMLRIVEKKAEVFRKPLWRWFNKNRLKVHGFRFLSGLGSSKCLALKSKFIERFYNAYSYHLNKISAFAVDDIEDKVKLICELDKTLVSSGELDISLVNQRCLRIRVKK